MLIGIIDLLMLYGIDIPQVIRNGLHPSRTKVSQAAYMALVTAFEVVYGSI